MSSDEISRFRYQIVNSGAQVKQRFAARGPLPLLSSGVGKSLAEGVGALTTAGATIVTGGGPASGPGCRFANTLLRVDGQKFLAAPAKLQAEAFGNAALVIVALDVEQAREVLGHLEGNLTGCIYSDTRGADDGDFELGDRSHVLVADAAEGRARGVRFG